MIDGARAWPGRLVAGSPAAPGTGSTRRSAFVATILLAGAAGLGDAAIEATGQLRAIMWGGLAMAAYGYGIIWVIAAVRGPGRGMRSWKIGPWMMAWAGTSYGLATLTWSQQQPGLATEIEPGSVLRALCLVAVGTTTWAIGYLTGPGRPLRACADAATGVLQRRFTGEVRGPAAPWILSGIGFAARLIIALTTGRLGYVGDAASAVASASWYGQFAAVLTLAAPLGVAAAALRVYRERVAGGRMTLAVLLLAEVAYGVASGNKLNYMVAAPLAALVPRALWPGKPILAPAYQFGQEYFSCRRRGECARLSGPAAASLRSR